MPNLENWDGGSKSLFNSLYTSKCIHVHIHVHVRVLHVHIHIHVRVLHVHIHIHVRMLHVHMLIVPFVVCCSCGILGRSSFIHVVSFTKLFNKGDGVTKGCVKRSCDRCRLYSFSSRHLNNKHGNKTESEKKQNVTEYKTQLCTMIVHVTMEHHYCTIRLSLLYYQAIITVLSGYHYCTIRLSLLYWHVFYE